jgi:hypothetical protein
MQWAADCAGSLDLHGKFQSWRLVGRKTDALTTSHSVKDRSCCGSGFKRAEGEVSGP